MKLNFIYMMLQFLYDFFFFLNFQLFYLYIWSDRFCLFPLILFNFGRMSATANVILQKLCTILSLLKQLLSIERLSDSCILQLVRTSLQTLLVDNIQLLQLKAIGLIGGVMRFAYLVSGPIYL